MRNKGIWGKGLRVGECEVARTHIHKTSLYIHKTPLYIHIHTYIYTYNIHKTHITYKSIIHIYLYLYTNTNIQNTHIPLHICKSIIPFPSMHICKSYPTYTYTFVVFYTYLQVVPGCFSLFRFSLNKGYFYSMTYSFPIFLHRFPYFLANLLIFNYLCIKLF